MGDWLVGLWMEELRPLLAPVWDSAAFWRLLLLTAVAALVLVAWPLRGTAVRLLTKPQRVEHDRQVFKNSCRVIGEVALERFLGGLIAAHDCRSDTIISAKALVDFLCRPGNQYLSRKISRRAVRLSVSLRSLLDFLSAHFFASPEAPPTASFRVALEPELNPDTSTVPSTVSSAKYHELAAQLVQRCRKAEADFSAYRRTVKDELAL